MKKNLLKVAVLFVAALFSVMPAKAAHEDYLKESDGWTKITALPEAAELGNYYFAIVEDSQDKIMKLAQCKKQGQEYKTMWYTPLTENPVNEKVALWTLETMEGVSGYENCYTMRNMSAPSFVMQTPSSWEPWNFRLQIQESQSDLTAVGIAYTENGEGGYWTLRNACRGESYIGHWDNTDEIAGNKGNGDGKFQIYSILKSRSGVSPSVADITLEKFGEKENFAAEMNGGTRFGTPQKWTVENFGIQYHDGKGYKNGIDNDGGKNRLYLGHWNESCDIPTEVMKDARIYKLVDLEAGRYFFEVDLNACTSNTEAYLFAATKACATDEIPSKAIAYADMRTFGENNGYHGITFELATAQQVLLGYQVDVYNEGNPINIEYRTTKVRLLKSDAMPNQNLLPVDELEDGKEYFIMNSNTTLSNRYICWDWQWDEYCLRTNKSYPIDGVKYKATKVTEEDNVYWKFQITSGHHNGRYLNTNGANVKADDNAGLWVATYETSENEEGDGFRLHLKGQGGERQQMQMNGSADWVVSYENGRTDDQTANTSHWSFYKVSDIDDASLLETTIQYNEANKIGTQTVDINIAEDVKFSTCILKFDTSLPAGLNAYTAAGVVSDCLVLEEVSSLVAYTPYILYAENGYQGTLSGQINAANYQAVVSGTYLSGAIENQVITEGYALSKKSEGVGFYVVGTGQKILIPAGKCWLSAVMGQTPGVTARSIGFSFRGGDADGINKVETEQTVLEGAIYTLDGKRVSQMERGQIYIINGQKVMVK